MRRFGPGILGLLSLLLVALLAHSLRDRAARSEELRIDAGAEAYSWIEGSSAAYHLRRIELALVNGRVPSGDVFLGFPAQQPVPWPPLFDTALAVYAQVKLGQPPAFERGERGLPDQYERQLEGLLVEVPPWLGVWASLAVGLGAGLLVLRIGSDGKGGTGSSRHTIATWLAACAGALIYACAPVAVGNELTGRIDHTVAIAILFALHMAAVNWVLGRRDNALNGRDAVDATLGGLIAGGLGGLALLTAIEFALFVGLAGLAFFLQSLSRDLGRQRAATRAGALYFLSASGVTVFPGLGSAWNGAQPGSLTQLTTAVPMALLACAIAFAAGSLLGGLRPAGPGPNRLIRAAVAVLVVAVALVWMPGFSGAAQHFADWAKASQADPLGRADLLGFANIGARLQDLLQDLGWCALALPPMLVALVGIIWSDRRQSKRPDRARSGGTPLGSPAAFLLINLLVLGAMSMIHGEYSALLLAAFGIAAGALLGWSLTVRSSPWRWAGAALMGSVLWSCGSQVYGTQVQGRQAADFDVAEHAYRSELVRGLRWLRAQSPWPGSWLAPDLRQERGVLTLAATGGPVVYHSRWPVLAADLGAHMEGARAVEARELLLGQDPAAFVQGLQERGLAYVVVLARQVQSDAPFWGGKDPSKTMLWQLAVEGESSPIPGIERVFASSRLEPVWSGSALQSKGPLVSIWRLAVELE